MDSPTASRRVIIISPTESELTSRGKRHPNLAMYLAKRCWKVEYFSTSMNHAEKRIFSQEELRQGTERVPYSLTFIDIGMYKQNISLQRILWNRRLARQCCLLLANRLGKDDILIVPSRPPELIYAAACLKHATGCRLLLDIRDIWPDALSDCFRINKILFAAYCNYYLNRSMTKFDSYIHVAPSFLPWLRRYAPLAQSEFIPLGFDEDRWGISPPTHSWEEGRKIRLVYCGTLTNQFNIMPLLEALTQRRGQFHLTLIGDNGTGERYADVIEFIRANNLDAQVKVLGLLPADRLVEELPRHDITIVPMVSGALPNKVFDSIAAGLPILSLGTGDCSAFVEEYDLGWTASFNSESVSTVLDNVTHDEIVRKTENIINIRSKYMHQTLFDKYEQVLRDIL